MDMTLRPVTPAERLYAYKQSADIGSHCGAVGCLRGDMGEDGQAFHTTWEDCSGHLWTTGFLVDREKVLDALRLDERYGGVLKDRDTLTAYCKQHPESDMGRYDREYVFRLDTEQYTYFLRLCPDDLEYDFELLPYRRDLFDLHMEQAEKGIRFITPDGKEKFRVADGDMVRITTSEGASRDRMARYFDDCHAEIGGSFYHTREFAEWMKESNSKVIPLRPGLPEKCYAVLPSGDEIITIKHGEDGYFHTDRYGHDRTHAQAIVDKYNEQINVTKAQAAAMLAGSMFGWEVPAADPKNYDELGQPIKPKHHDRGDAR